MHNSHTMMDIDSPAASANIIRNHRQFTRQPILKYSSSSSSSIPQHVINNLDDHRDIIESPSFLPRGTCKTKGKSRPDLLNLRTQSFKRPLSPSLSIDSPTTSLAADLSQNFHIEKNNQNKVPTPKRSLFPKSMGYNSSMVDTEDVENIMDMSQLVAEEKLRSEVSQPPFRKPFGTLQKSGSSTSSLATTKSSLSVTSCSSISSNPPINASNQSFHIYNDNNTSDNDQHENTKVTNNPVLQRRGMRRAFSNNTFSNRNASMINGSLFQPSMNQLNNDDLDLFCVPSPIQEKITPSAEHSYDLSNLNFNDMGSDSENDDSPSLKREVGSPIQQRVSSKIKTARAKVRRTHSMFQNSKDYFTNDKLSTSLINKISTNMTMLSFDNEPITSAGNATLPKTHIKTIVDSKNLIPRINVEEFVNILDGKYSEFFEKILIVDCRFEYEFNGGHIDGAMNISSQSDLEHEFLNGLSSAPRPQGNKTLLIFHCEFSSYRGPLMANHLRKADRLLNSDNYPNLHYPDILILEGGYKNFFELQSHRCLPKCYVLMNDSKHQESCEIQMHRIRRDSKLQNSRSLKKAKSFHVGIPNLHSLHLRSRSQTIFQLTSLHNPSSSSSSASATTTATTNNVSSSRPSSIQRARHSSSLLSLTKHHSMKFNQRSSIQSFSSITTSTTAESDEDIESDVLNSYFSNRDSGDGITSFFDNQTSSNNNTLSSFLEESRSSVDFKFPSKGKIISTSQQQQQQHLSSSSNSALKLTETLREHRDTPIMAHKKQKSSGHLYRSVTQPNIF